MIKSALILDLNNLYFSIQKKFGRDYKLVIDKYVKTLEEQGHLFVHKLAYSIQTPDDAHKFMSLLNNLGFEVNFGREDWAIPMALRLTDICPNVDSIVLGSSQGQYWRLLSYARDKSKLTKCYACGVPGFFKQYAVCTEVDETVLKRAELAAPKIDA